MRAMRRLVIIVMWATACGPSARKGSGADGGSSDGSRVDATALRDAPVSGVQCSSDLHDVLDGSGQVVVTCPPDQGCAAGACVPACAAAAASQGSVGCDFVIATPSFLPA